MSIFNQLGTTVVLLLLMYCSALAQSIDVDLAKVQSTYANVEKLSVNVAYKLFANTADKEPEEVINGYYKRNGNEYKAKTYEIDMIMGKNELVVIDEPNKTIIIKDPKVFPVGMKPIPIEESLKYAESIKFSETNTHKIYTINFKPDFDSKYVVLYINKTNWFIDKIIMELQLPFLATLGNIPSTEITSAKLEIEYHGLNLSPQFTANEFSTLTYVVASDKVYTPAAKYKNYQIVNLKTPNK